MKKEFKQKENFKTTRNKNSRIIHYDNDAISTHSHLFSFTDCGYEYNDNGYFYDREHDLGYMFTYTISGTAELTYEGKNQILHKGDLCMIELEKKSILKVINNNHWEIYFIHLIGANIDDIYRAFVNNCGQIKHDFNPEKMINCVENLLERPDKYRTSLLIYETLIDALEQSSSIDNENIGINKAINYFYDMYREEISLEDVCNEINFSKFHFIRKFKDATGMPPKQFLLELRIKKACELLLTSNMSLTDIAVHCGFKTAKNLYYSFTKIYGIGPREYQKSRKIEEKS